MLERGGLTCGFAAVFCMVLRQIFYRRWRGHIDACAKAIARAFSPLRIGWDDSQAFGPYQTNTKATTTTSGASCIHPTHRDVAAMDGAPGNLVMV